MEQSQNQNKDIMENTELRNYQKAYRKLEAKEAKNGFIIHTITFVLVNSLLIWINYSYTPEHLWFFWSLVGWGFGLVMHLVYGVIFLNKELHQKEVNAEKLMRDLEMRSV